MVDSISSNELDARNRILTWLHHTSGGTIIVVLVQLGVFSVSRSSVY
jgi:hypothetical protein